MSILLCIPIIVNHEVAREAINQVINRKDVTVILCNNGGDQHIDQLLDEYREIENIKFWKKEKNIYVNPIWNEFIQYFLQVDQWDHLIIMNSDLTLCRNWDEILHWCFSCKTNVSIVPITTDDKTKIYVPTELMPTAGNLLYEGIPGIFITLSKKQAKLVYPIPEECKIWFGDTWIYSILVALGEAVMSIDQFIAYHHHSTSVSTVPGIHDLIEKDKVRWEKVVQPAMIEHILELKKTWE